MKDTFRYFIRKTWPEAGKELSNEAIDSLGIEFEKYLNENVPKEKQLNFVPKSPAEVIMDSENPMKKNGFHFGYVMHFTEFMNKLKEAEEKAS